MTPPRQSETALPEHDPLTCELCHAEGIVAELREYRDYIHYLKAVIRWVATEIDNDADAVGPVPDLVEEGLRHRARKLWKVADGESVDLGVFGPAKPRSIP